MKKKNNQTFLTLYNQYVDGVFRYCFYKTSDRDVALDITQEVFAKIWEYMEKGGVLENEKAFVYSTASRKIIDWYRTKKSNVSLDTLHEAGFDFADEEKEQGFRIDGEKALLLVKDLDDIYRDVLILRYVEELTIKEIAEALQETENNISVRLHRGIEKLKQLWTQTEK